MSNQGHGWKFAIPAEAVVEMVVALTADTSLYRLRLPGNGYCGDFSPGRFLQVSVAGGGEVPISLAGIDGDGRIDLCVRRAGHITGMMKRISRGDRLGLRGPFGNGFPVERWRGRNILLIAGGLGIAPIRGLLHYLLLDRASYGEITLMYGARTPAAVLFREELLRLSCRKDLKILLTVDFINGGFAPGLSCNTGLLTELLAKTTIPTHNTVAAVCGPPALYRCLVGELEHAGIHPGDIFLSLERRMKCGTGTCCHCAIGHLFCCTDGPVFTYDALSRVPEAL